MAIHAQTLSTLIDGILRGGIRVVDLTVPLDAATQTIRLPPLGTGTTSAAVSIPAPTSMRPFTG